MKFVSNVFCCVAALYSAGRPPHTPDGTALLAGDGGEAGFPKWRGMPSIPNPMDAVEDRLNKAKDKLKDAGGKLKDGLGGIKDGFGDIKDGIQQGAHRIRTGADHVYDWSVESRSDLLAWASDRRENMTNAHGRNMETLTMAARRFDQALHNQFHKAQDRFVAKAVAVRTTLRDMNQNIKKFVGDAYRNAKADFKEYNDKMQEIYRNGIDKLGNHYEAVKTMTSKIVKRMGGAIASFASWATKAALATVVGFTKLVMVTLILLMRYIAQAKLDALTDCVVGNCTVYQVDLFGRVANKLFSPAFTAWDQQEGAGEDPAEEAERTSIYELACGFGNVSMWDTSAGPDYFHKSMHGGFEANFTGFQTNFKGLDKCVRETCSAESVEVWEVLQTGLPAHCAELFDKPARHHAGVYEVQYQIPPNPGFRMLEGSHTQLRIDCHGFVFSRFGGEERMSQPLGFLDVEEVCHNRPQRDGPNLEGDLNTFYINNLFQDRNMLQCLRIADDGASIVGSHYKRPERTQQDPGGILFAHAHYTLMQREKCDLDDMESWTAGYEEYEMSCIDEGYDLLKLAGAVPDIDLDACSHICDATIGCVAFSHPGTEVGACQLKSIAVDNYPCPDKNLFKKKSPGGYVRQRSAFMPVLFDIAGPPAMVFHDRTLAECAELCNNDLECQAFQIAQGYVYGSQRLGECYLSKTIAYSDGLGLHNTDVYVKELRFVQQPWQEGGPYGPGAFPGMDINH